MNTNPVAVRAFTPEQEARIREIVVAVLQDSKDLVDTLEQGLLDRAFQIGSDLMEQVGE